MYFVQDFCISLLCVCLFLCVCVSVCLLVVLMCFYVCIHAFVSDENARVLRLCEAHDGSSSVSVCRLGLTSAALVPLLRALKLQASLTELRLSANRLGDSLIPELLAAAGTMPRLRLLDVSANLITGEGLKKAADSLDGKNQPTFPVSIPWVRQWPAGL